MPAPVAASLIRIARGESYPAALTFELPTGTLALATAIRFVVKREPGDPIADALLVAAVGSGITVTGDAVAALLLSVAQTTALPLGRLHWSVWLTLSTGEAYETDAGILVVEQGTGSPDLPP